MNVELTVKSGLIHRFRTSTATYCGLVRDGKLDAIYTWRRGKPTCPVCLWHYEAPMRRDRANHVRNALMELDLT